MAEKSRISDELRQAIFTPESIKFGEVLAHAPPGEEIVISGIAGVYPESENVAHFQKNLFNKYDMVNDEPRRWEPTNEEIPQRTGKLVQIDKFDSGFFDFHHQQADSCDPIQRISLEKSYEAILDAGINPKEIQGTRTGIFIGTCFFEIEKFWLFGNVSPYGILSSRSIITQRLAYYYGLDSWDAHMMDTACSSSCYALDWAYRCIRDGRIDTAIVGGANLCLNPTISLQFARLGVLSKDGTCKVFDQKADGYVRSESNVFMILQKAKDARRIYCKVLHSKVNSDGYKEEGIAFPSGLLQQALMEQCYEEAKINPNEIAYVEAHGTGTAVGDPEEAKGLEQIFCNARKSALPIGSVKSNIGHSEPAAGLNSLTKVIIAMETGYIPPNINFETPNKDIPGLLNGKLRVVSEKEPLSGDLMALNSFGFGGANAHIILERHKKDKNAIEEPNHLPYLVTLSGRTEESMLSLFDALSPRPIDREYIRLFHSIHTYPIPGHLYKGYVLLNGGDKETHFQYYSGQPNRLVAIFSGLDKGWAQVGRNMLKLPIFEKFLEEPAMNLLKTRQFDLFQMFRLGVEETALHSIVAAVAVQIALVHILETINIKFDHYAGISYGEIVAGYAEGVLSVHDALLIAHSVAQLRVKEQSSLSQSILIGNQMVNFLNSLNSKEIQLVWQHKDIVLIQCDKNNHRLINLLIDKGFILFNNDLSFWSLHKENKLMDILSANLKRVSNEEPILSSRWIKSNFSLTKSIGKISFLEYLVLALVKVPKFDHFLSQISEDNYVVDFSRTGLIPKVFSLNTIQFGNESQKDNLDEFFINLGKLFEVGAQPKLDLLYPTVQYPVSRGTPMISPLIKWDYTRTWVYEPYTSREYEISFKIDLIQNNDKFYGGHVVDGRNLFPASGYLYLVWVYLKEAFEKNTFDFPIIFENIRFIRGSHIPKNDALNLVVTVNTESGFFQILENSNLVVTGKVYCPKSTEKEFVEFPSETISSDICLNKDDLYKELKLRGYQYADFFQGLLEAKPDEKRAIVEWRYNWVTFIDIMLQSLILSEKGRGLFVPISIDRIVIDPNRHQEMLKNCEEVVENENSTYKKVPLKFSEYLQMIQSGGVEIRGFYFSGIQRRKVTAEPVLEKYCFVPYEVVTEPKDWKLVLQILTHIMLENQSGFKIKIIEFANEDEQQQQLQEEGMPDILSEQVSSILLNLPLYQGEMIILGVSNEENIREKINSEITIKSQRDLPNEQKDIHLIIHNNLVENPDKIEQLVSCLVTNGMLLVRAKEEITTMITALDSQFDIISKYRVDNEQHLILFKKKINFTSYEVIKFNSRSFGWISGAKHSLEQVKKKTDCSVVFVSENEDFSGLLGFYNCISKENVSVKIQCVLINDVNAPKFDINDSFYQNQIQKHVAVNILKNGIWGSYRHLPLEPVPVINSLSAYVDVTVRGDLSSIQWIQDDIDPSTWTPKSDIDVLVQVHYCSLNFRDIMMATGKLASSFSRNASRVTTNQGLEFSGRTLDGRRVFGLAASKAMSTYVVGHKSLIWDIPDNMSMEDAATLPVIYLTCIYSLVIRGNLKPGETVLIHAGTGGIGQAAITIALLNKCRVLATCAPHKKQSLLEIFPELDANDIGNSRDCTFYDMVMERTNGRGVDVLLNSLAEEKLIYGLKCLAPGGRFVEIGKYDLSLNVSLNLEILKRGISFHGVMLDQIMIGPEEQKKECNESMNKFLSGIKRAITRTVFQKEDSVNAFRYMASGKHLGKVLIQVRPEDAPVAPIYVPCVPRVIAKEQNSYIVIGGLGGLGLELVNWLINRGAYKVILNSRSGVTDGYQASRIEIWRKELNATIVISKDDITNKQGVENLLMKANQLGPVAGIFNLAVNLKDDLFDNQTEENFQLAAAPKAFATRLLDQASRRLCPELEYFVVFSSVSCGRGNISQTNYGMANAVMERIMEKRKSDGLPGLAVEWGAVGDVGLVAKMQGNNQNFTIGGTLLQGINSCLACLDNFMLQSEPIVSSMVVAEKINLDTSNPVSYVAQILSLNLKTISQHATLSELGMDSMMGVEIKQGLEREFGLFLTPKDLRSLTIAKLLEYNFGDQQNANKDNLLNRIDERNLLSFIEYSDIDQLNLPIIKLDSKKSTGNPIFLLPGIESNSKPFMKMAETIEAPVYFIQLNRTPVNNFEELTAYLISLITNELRNLEPNEVDEIRLIGYSIGSSILYCLVQELENLGHRCRIIFIDGAPKLMYALASMEKRDDLEPKEEIAFIETGILIKLVDSLSDEYKSTMKIFFEKIVILDSWNERVEFLLNNIKMQLPADLITEALQGIRNRFFLVINNDLLASESIKMLESPAILVRTIDKMVKDIEDDYGLSLICKNIEKVHFAEGDHISILKSVELSNIVNKFFLSSH